MKRLLISVCIAILVLAISIIPVLAAARGDNGGCHASDCTNKQCARGDGVCDNKNAQCNRGVDFTDEDGDGVCDNKNTQCNRGEGFTDEDSDGICDNKNTQCAGTESAEKSCGKRGNCHGKMTKQAE